CPSLVEREKVPRESKECGSLRGGFAVAHSNRRVREEFERVRERDRDEFLEKRTASFSEAYRSWRGPSLYGHNKTGSKQVAAVGGHEGYSGKESQEQPLVRRAGQQDSQLRLGRRTIPPRWVQ